MIKNIKIFLIIFFIFFPKTHALENKIILKVNNDIITTIDILNEINQLKFFNKNIINLSDEEIYKISLNSILQHKIKNNEILKNRIKLTDNDYLNSIIEDRYEQMGFKDLKSFKQELIVKKIDFEHFVEKIKVELIWNQLIYLKFNDKLIIDTEELKKKILNQNTSYKVFNLKEILFQVSSVNEIDNIYMNIKNDIQKIGFENAAIKFSTSETALDGGKLGWVEEKLLNKELLNELNSIPLGEITKPIRISSGFLILQKYNVRDQEKNFDEEFELNRIINFEKNRQLKNFSNLYYNKVKMDIKVNAP